MPGCRQWRDRGALTRRVGQGRDRLGSEGRDRVAGADPQADGGRGVGEIIARKNLLLEVVDDGEPVAVAPPASTAATAPPRPAAVGVRGAPGMVGRSLAALATKATSAEHMEAQL